MKFRRISGGRSPEFLTYTNYVKELCRQILALLAGICLFIVTGCVPETDSHETPSAEDITFYGDSKETPSLYEVQQGDTLAGISRSNYGTSRHWKVIAEHNNIPEPGQISPGDKLKIPEFSEDGENLRNYSSPSEIVYTVKKGDTLWRIATSHDLIVNELVKYNNISTEESLTVGQTLILPAR